MVVAVISLIVALSGTAIAAKTMITRSAQIKNGIITSADLKDGKAVNAKDLTPAARTALTGSGGAAGAAGAQGVPGVPGVPGAAGADGAKGDTGTPDPTNFFDKAASDERFVNGDETAFLPSNVIGFARRDVDGNPTEFFGTIFELEGIGSISLLCEKDPTTTSLTYLNTSGRDQELFLDLGTGNPSLHDVAPQTTESLTIPVDGYAVERVLVQVGGGTRSTGPTADAEVATIVMTTANSRPADPDNCLAQIQALGQTI